jgi:cytochrome d ubiquinol oxidase subunit II
VSWPVVTLGAVMLAGLVLYALLGGADFGGGLWDLLASGPRQARQRELIAHAIGPVWEANHVWLILVIVVLFVGFPAAFAEISVRLHVPLTALLVAIVLRGAAFTFRAYDPLASQHPAAMRRWGRVFSTASIAGPLLLGMIVGALAQGGRAAPARAALSGLWLGPFPLVVGLFTLALFGLVSAVYLTVEAEAADPELAADFRRRALAAAVAVGWLALATFVLSARHAPLVRDGLTRRAWSLPLHLLTGVAAMAVIVGLWWRRYPWARRAVVVQASGIVLGWGASQFPFIAVPDLTLDGMAGPRRMQELLVGALAAGFVVLVPSLIYLFRVFKAGPRHRTG